MNVAICRELLTDGTCSGPLEYVPVAEIIESAQWLDTETAFALTAATAALWALAWCLRMARIAVF